MARAVCYACLVLTVVIGGFLAERFWQQSHPAASAAAVVVQADGSLREVSAPVATYPGTRVLLGRSTAEIAAKQRAWLDNGSVPEVDELSGSDLVTDALLDLNTLGLPYGGVPVAGWTQPWRYVWPRDSAFAASALARSGHLQEAAAILDFLQRVQPVTGVFQARYRPDGSGPPDSRGTQLESTGWALWALSQVSQRDGDPGQANAFLTRYHALLQRSAQAILQATAGGTELPAASADYWETHETRVTLETCSALLMGLRQAEQLYAILGDARQVRLKNAADQFEAVILANFAADGFPRRLGGAARTIDLGVALLLPPFNDVQDGSVLAAWRASATYMSRPAGGLAPGGSWRRDGISWTNVTSVYAMVDACLGLRAEAVGRLRWLDGRRTEMGSLPEKVRSDGSPASVAPLAWTAAGVVITADELSAGCSPT